MNDTNKYRVWLTFANPRTRDFETRNDLVDWVANKGTAKIQRITFNNKSGAGRTGWVDGKTLLRLWQDVDRKRNQEK